jgi:tetratricopeptide (TPR) repeat protein
MLCSFFSSHFGKLSESEERDWLSALIQSEEFEVCLWAIDSFKKIPLGERLYLQILCLFELGFYDDIITFCKKEDLAKVGLNDENVHTLYLLAIAYEKTNHNEKSKILFDEIYKSFPNYKSIYSKISTTVLSIPR